MKKQETFLYFNCKLAIANCKSPNGVLMSFLLYLSIFLFITVCVFLILLVLIQKGRGGGLASAFGGMGGNTAFGSKTGDVLTWATSIVFGVFILLAVVLNILSNSASPKRTSARVQSPAATQPVQNEAPATAPR